MSTAARVRSSRDALVVLKTLSFPERIDGSYRLKAGSDTQDLYRLVERPDLDELARGIAESGPELTTFIGVEPRHYFTADHADFRLAKRSAPKTASWRQCAWTTSPHFGAERAASP